MSIPIINYILFMNSCSVCCRPFTFLLPIHMIKPVKCCCNAPLTLCQRAIIKHFIGPVCFFRFVYLTPSFSCSVCVFLFVCVCLSLSLCLFLSLNLFVRLFLLITPHTHTHTLTLNLLFLHISIEIL